MTSHSKTVILLKIIMTKEELKGNKATAKVGKECA